MRDEYFTKDTIGVRSRLISRKLETVPDQFVPLFPTTLMKRRLLGMAEHNAALAAITRALEGQRNASVGTSTKGGFQTGEDLLSSEHAQARHPSLLALKHHIGEAVQEYSGLLIRQECALSPNRINFALWGWGVILREGNWQAHHVHPNAHISGVYYIAAPPATLEAGREDGKISFSDPRPRANMSQLVTQKTRHAEAPVPGDMVIFPSWLEHSVAPFQGEGERICIAFNARLEMA
ncbi:MAG TPA: TIGR02466 family protein [Rhizomicrobium sp.]|nr:TIGR02466 family protein [Rhizomicrobium sp.]